MSVNSEWMERPSLRGRMRCCSHAAAGLRAAALRGGGRKGARTRLHAGEASEQSNHSSREQGSSGPGGGTSEALALLTTFTVTAVEAHAHTLLRTEHTVL